MEHITFNVNGKEYDTLGDYDMRITAFEPDDVDIRTYDVEIPGRDGVLDMTEALTGDVVYDNYNIIVKLLNIDRVSSYGVKEDVYTRMKNDLHGRKVTFVTSFDPEYTYTGRVSITRDQSLTFQAIEMSIDCEPYRSKGVMTEAYNVTQGLTAYISSGRKAVRPVFEFTDDVILIYDGTRYEMPKGAYTLQDVIFTQGTNELFMIAGKARSHITHGEMGAYTYSDVKTLRTIYEWYQGQEKWTVERITMEGTDPFVTGNVTFTATDETGASSSMTLALGDSFIGLYDGVSDTLVIEGGIAKLYKRVIRETAEDGTITYQTTEQPFIEVYDFPELYSNAGEIVSVSSTSSAPFTYEVSKINTQQDITEALHSDYMEGGDVAMTHAEMGCFKHGSLRFVNRGTISVEEEDLATVYVQYDWKDL